MGTRQGIYLFDYCHRLMQDIKAARKTSESVSRKAACLEEDIEKQSDFFFVNRGSCSGIIVPTTDHHLAKRFKADHMQQLQQNVLVKQEEQEDQAGSS